MGTGGWHMSTRDTVALRIIEDFRAGRVTRAKAALILGVDPRTVSRWASWVRREGPAAIKHGNCARRPHNRLDAGLRDRALSLAAERYKALNLKHLHERLVADHGFTACYDTLRKWCNAAGIGRRRKRRASRARLYRERMANEGLMLQMDGSHHRWFGGKESCLIAVIDDATSHIPAAGFFDGETTWACFEILRRILTTKGIPEIFYVDGAGWTGGGHKRQFFSQFVRACGELGIRVIHARSAEAKGRIERAFGTMQDRLVAELQLAGITVKADAERYLQQVFLPTYWNRRLTVAPREETTRYRPLTPNVDLERILSFQTPRLVNRDHTVSLEGKKYKLAPGEFGSLRGRTVTASRAEDGELTWYLGATKLAAKVVKPLIPRAYDAAG